MTSLTAARKARDIVIAVAEAAWAEVHDGKPPRLPTLAGLTEWATEAPDDGEWNVVFRKGDWKTLQLRHQEWDGKSDHFLFPIIRAWQSNPIDVKPDKRENGIMPKPAAAVRRMVQTGELFPASLTPGPVGGRLPDMPTYRDEIVPSLPAVLFDQTRMTPATGAPLALRLFVESMLSTDRALREGTRSQRIAITPQGPYRDALA